MNQWSRFTGVITAMVTPFDEAGRLNLPTLRRLIALQMRAGVDGVLVCGGSGEYANLSAEERAEVTQAAVEAAGGQVFVVVGVLEASTARACEAVKLLAAARPSAFMVLTPYYFNPSPDGVRAHFEAVAANTSLPIILYNNPARTGINMSAELVAQLGTIGPVVGIKECDRDLGRVTQKIEAAGDRIDFLAGDDDLVLPMLALAFFSFLQTVPFRQSDGSNAISVDPFETRVFALQLLALALLAVLFFRYGPATASGALNTTAASRGC